MAPQLAGIGYGQVAEEYANEAGELYPELAEHREQVGALERRRATHDRDLDRIRAALARFVDGSGRTFAHRRAVPVVVELLVLAAVAVIDYPLNTLALLTFPLDLRVAEAAAVALSVLVAGAAWALARGTGPLLRWESRPACVKAATCLVLGAPAFWWAIAALASLRERALVASPAATLSAVPLAGLASVLAKLQAALIVLAVVVSCLADNPLAAEVRRLRRTERAHEDAGARLTDEADRARRVIARTRATLVIVRRRCEAQLVRIRHFSLYLVEVYRAHLLRRHAHRDDPRVASRPPVAIPAGKLPADPWDDEQADSNGQGARQEAEGKTKQ
jgi:hypothetical protein